MQNFVLSFVSLGINNTSKPGLWGGTVSTLEFKVNITQEMNGIVYTCQSANEALQRSVHEAISLDVLCKYFVLQDFFISLSPYFVSVYFAVNGASKVNFLYKEIYKLFLTLIICCYLISSYLTVAVIMLSFLLHLFRSSQICTTTFIKGCRCRRRIAAGWFAGQCQSHVNYLHLV